MAPGFDTAFTDTVQGGAVVVALVCAGGMAVAVLAEGLRWFGCAPRLLAKLDFALPAPARRIAAVVLASLVAVLGSMRPVAAEDSVRSWLRGTEASDSGSPATPPGTASTTSAPPTTSTTTQAPLIEPPPPVPSVGVDAARHVVRRGECLWSIAAAQLGRGASNAQIDAAWRLIYATNHDAIGPNPSLIRPGLVLALPAALSLPPFDARP